MLQQLGGWHRHQDHAGEEHQAELDVAGGCQLGS